MKNFSFLILLLVLISTSAFAQINPNTRSSGGVAGGSSPRIDQTQQRFSLFGERPPMTQEQMQERKDQLKQQNLGGGSNFYGRESNEESSPEVVGKCAYLGGLMEAESKLNDKVRMAAIKGIFKGAECTMVLEEYNQIFVDLKTMLAECTSDGNC